MPGQDRPGWSAAGSSTARFFLTAAASPWRAIPLWISQPGADPSAWSFRGGPDLQKLSASALDDQARSRLGFPSRASPGAFPSSAHRRPGRPGSSSGPICRGSQRGAIPLISAPRQLSPRTTILIETPSRTRSRVEAVGLRRIDNAVAERLGSAWRGEESPASTGIRSTSPDDLVAHAFFLTESGRKSEPDHRGTGPGSRDGPHSRCLPDQSAPPARPLSEPAAPASPCREDRRTAILPARECLADPGPARWRGHHARVARKGGSWSACRRAAPASGSRRSTSTSRRPGPSSGPATCCSRCSRSWICPASRSAGS